MLAGIDDGQGRRDEKLRALEERRSVFVNRGRRVLLLRLLEAGTGSADDVRAAIELPADIDARCLGVVPGPLARAGIIHPAGFVKSNRPERHASYIQEWILADRDAAVRWLQDHPDRLDETDNDSEWLFPVALKGCQSASESDEGGTESTFRGGKGV